MSDDPCTIGINHPAFSVSKTVLLEWVNSFFELDYNKVEQCASGAIHCQIADAIFPGKVPMKNVNWSARTDYDYVKNFKILQNVFVKQGVRKPVPIDKLVKAKYQDNLEWLQWMKHFFTCKYTGEDYNPTERRNLSSKAPKKTTIKRKPAATKSTTSSATSTTKKSTVKSKATSSGASSTQLKALNDKISQLQLTVQGLERERDFYFGKLREVEVLCQTKTEAEGDDATIACSEILAILYKTDEEDEGEGGEEQVEDEEETY